MLANLFTPQAPLGVKLVLIVTLLALYYAVGKKYLYAVNRRLARRIPVGGRYTTAEVGGILELSAGASTHLMFCALLLVVTGVSATSAGLWVPPNPVLLLLGAVVGVCVLAFSSFLVLVTTSMLTHIGPAGTPTRLENWVIVARGGWFRHYVQTLDAIPLPVALTLTTAQIAGEEIVFRGILIPYFAPSSPFLALTISVSAFTIMQAFLMPSWDAALIPMIGAATLGIVNGLLFLSTPNIWPLITAHVIFFVAGMR